MYCLHGCMVLVCDSLVLFACGWGTLLMVYVRGCGMGVCMCLLLGCILLVSE